jgi:hypothetical protein
MTRVAAARPQSVEPKRSVGIDHDLDDQWIGHGSGDRRSHGGPQHRALARGSLREVPCLSSDLRVRRPVASGLRTRAIKAAKRQTWERRGIAITAQKLGSG